MVSGVRSHEDTANHAEVFEILRSDGKNPLLCAGLAIKTTSPFDEFPDAKVTMMRAIEASLNPKVPLPKDLSRNSEDIRARADSEKVTDKRTLESMTKAAEVMINAWEMGDEESYRSFVSTENGGMSLEIPAQSLDVNGFDAIWQIRSSMGNDPLDIYKVEEAVADGNILTVVVKLTNRKTGVSSMFLNQLTFSASLTCEKFWVGPMNETKGDNRLAGKVCVVLGGTGNIGAGVAFAYASEGAKVIITGRTHEKIAASRKQWGWPTSVSGLALDFSTDEIAAASIEAVWSAAGGDVDHVCNSIGFGATTPAFTECKVDDITAFLSEHQYPRIRASKLVGAKLMHVEGSTLVNLSGAFAVLGTHIFDGGSGLWMNGLGGAAYMHSMYALSSEVRDKKGKLRCSTAVVHMLVSKNGELQQQFGMPAEADSSIHLGKVRI